MNCPTPFSAGPTTSPASQRRGEAVGLAVLTGQNGYAILYRLATAKRTETRTRRLNRYVAMLARGETIYPQR